jgi:hypothetical protein
MNEHPSPEFEKEIRESFNAQDANPTFVRGLRATLLERLIMKNQTRSFPCLAWYFAIIAILLLVVGLLIVSPGVAASLKQLLGYLPGIGYVHQGNSSLRVLSAPVMVEKNGLKVTIEKGIADLQKTVLFERIEGYPPPLDGYPAPTCETYPRLILPDGTILHGFEHGTSQDDSKGSFYSVSDTFEGMPAGQLDATLEIPCVMSDSNFRDFTLQLHFQIPDETQIMPVIELPTEAPTNPTPQTGLIVATAPSAELTVEGFSIVIESETPLADGYILAGNYEWTDPRFDGFSVQPDDPKITDANGKQLVFEPVDSVLSIDDPTIKKLPFAYKIIGKDYASPLTITVKSLIINNLPGQGTFQFDAGANPRAGQVWNVNIDVPVAGHIVHVQTIQLTVGRTPTELGFEFTMTSDSEVMCASVGDANPIITGNSGGGGGGGFDCGSSLVPFTSSWVIEGYSPAGIKTFVVSGLSVTFHGIWQAMWQPSTQ